MATSSGTSVIGSQVVISAVQAADAEFSIGLDGGIENPPIRVGFYYLVRYKASTEEDARLVDIGPVYRPGTRFRRQNISLDTAFRYRLWVDWNEAGLAWSVFTQ